MRLGLILDSTLRQFMGQFMYALLYKEAYKYNDTNNWFNMKSKYD